MQDNARVYQNKAHNGGGIHLSNRADASFEGNASVDGNQASKHGGGIYISEDAALIDNPTTVTAEESAAIIDNTAATGNGGGIYFRASSSSSDKVHFTTTGKVTISGNEAPLGDGGGIWCPWGTWNDVLTLSDKTAFAENSAKDSCLPPSDWETAYNNIGFSSISIKALVPYHPLNNYDINYANTEEFAILYWQYGDKFDYWKEGSNILFSFKSDAGTIALPSVSDMELPDGYSFLGWYDNDELTGDTVTSVVVDPAAPHDIHVHAKLEVTVPVTFKVVNGTWSDGSDTDIIVNVPLYDLNGKPSNEGEGELTSYIPTNMKPNNGYEGGAWDVEPPTTVAGTEPVVYTYSFNAVEKIPENTFPETEDSELPKADVSEVPETNDLQHIGLWLLLCVISGVVIWAGKNKGAKYY